ncbi:GTPase [Thioalkalivibrio sp. HK1]|uniref:GTPase n=1 Tax=Thioalkalivibrio sp. HK1 TaxID=1469245 RepID=UPI00046F2DD6|nr:GTPase [Thioalkalivibrio sp. HK1]
MPANLSPEYKSAEAAFRGAKEPKERLECLREMLRTIPKHKGTDRLQGDIKARIKQLTEELSGPKKGGARSGPALVIRPEGAAQIALLGPANTGKSSLVVHLTGAGADIGPYPFTTQFPQPAMLPYEDIQLQLVDLPPIAPERPISWLANALQPADAALLVVDLHDPQCIESTLKTVAILQEKRVSLLPDFQSARIAPDPGADDYDPFAIRLPTLIVATKADLSADPEGELEVFCDLAGFSHPRIATSIKKDIGLAKIGSFLFDELGIARVYTKTPGRPPDMGAPFTVRAGDTVMDVAGMIHKDIARALRYAKLWERSGRIRGRQVGRDHEVNDGDIIEIHT